MAVFGSKAETLERLAAEILGAEILPLHYFSVAQWSTAPDRVLRTIEQAAWNSGALIVRSSTLYEDNPETLSPGAYLSVPGVVGRKALRTAIDAVIASYRRDLTLKEAVRQQVLVQPMISGPTMTGVAFTCEPNTGAPYIIVNYEEHGDTAAVTSGKAAHLKTFYRWKYADTAALDDRLRRIVEISGELEDLFGHIGLDVEFAFDDTGRMYLLQVRPLTVRPLTDVVDQQAALDSIMASVTAAQARHPYLVGEYTVFGVMPDWNPAEIIGTRPRPLALSLYRRLVTDAQWSDQRRRYGYRDVRGFPLLLDFCGLPYIDVRASFNSLIPAELDDDLAERLATCYLNRLTANPELHDKVEFEIILSCYTLTAEQRLADQTGDLFDAGERARIIDTLRTHTNQLMRDDHPARVEDAASIDSLKQRLGLICDSKLDLVARIYWLLEDCRRFGTLAFAGFARLGFIAAEMLRSLVACGTLTDADAARLMASLNTATNRMLRDRSTMSRDKFLSVYGFLRPGTYDIRSPRYDETPGDYFKGMHDPTLAAELEPLMLPASTMRTIERLLRRHRLEQDASGLMSFIIASIQQREDSKFEFSRHLSEALSLIKNLGNEVGMNADDMSFISMECIDAMYRGTESPECALRRYAADGRQRFDMTRRIALPPMITRPDDITSFHLPPNEPNYVTQKAAAGPVEVLASVQSAELTGKVLMLPSGDPGYDWIFSQGIAGVITRYGGTNSHMAIRAHQFGIPAVIGVGDVLYRRWSAARYLRIDCQNRRVEELQ